MRAVSLNYRDLMMIQGSYSRAGTMTGPVVPFSDDEGAGEQWATSLATSSGTPQVLGLTLRDRQVTLHEVSS